MARCHGDQEEGPKQQVVGRGVGLEPWCTEQGEDFVERPLRGLWDWKGSLLEKGRLKEFPLSLINGDPETEEHRVTNGHHSV